jgi:hypothetical protein
MKNRNKKGEKVMNRNKKKVRNLRGYQQALGLVLGLLLVMPLAARAGDWFKQKLEKVESLAKDGRS